MRRLILVAGHAVPHRFDQLDQDAGWYLKHFQSGDGPAYVEHVRRGVELAARDNDALLLFAGGQTDAAAGPRSESQGYWLIADNASWYRHESVRERATTEEFSCDSFENVLFGLCRFREYTGRYPERVTAVGWIFKGPRFRYHAEVLRFSKHRFDYEGVNNPDDIDRAEHFEAKRLELFHQDPYGAGSDPVSKRAARNPFRRQHGYHVSCPEVRALLAHTGPELFDGDLPWD